MKGRGSGFCVIFQISDALLPIIPLALRRHVSDRLIAAAPPPVCSSLIHPIEDLGNPNKPACTRLRAPELWNYYSSVVICQQSRVLHFLTCYLLHNNVTHLLKCPLKSLIRADWINSDTIYSAPPQRRRLLILCLECISADFSFFIKL